MSYYSFVLLFFFFQAEDGIRDVAVTGVQTCALPIWDEDRAGDGGLLHERLVGGHVGGDSGAPGSTRAPRRLGRPVPREPPHPRDHGARGVARRPPRLWCLDLRAAVRRVPGPRALAGGRHP